MDKLIAVLEANLRTMVAQSELVQQQVGKSMAVLESMPPSPEKRALEESLSIIQMIVTDCSLSLADEVESLNQQADSTLAL